MAEERVYTINLGKALLSQPQHRAVRAVNMVREFASKHMRSSDVKIDEDLAHQIWARGARSPPRRVRVRMWEGESGEIIVSKHDGDVETKTVPAAADRDEPKPAETKAEPAQPEPESPETNAEPAQPEPETAEQKAPETKAEPAQPEPETADGPSPDKDEPPKP